MGQRRELIAAAFNKQLDSLIEELEPTLELSLDDLIRLGEGPTVEFKSSLRWDVVTRQVNKDLQRQTTKTIAAMLNSEGGVLLVGVADDGTAFGIESDIKTIGRRDLDGIGQLLASLISDSIGPEYGAFVGADYPTYRDSTVCRIRVEASPKPAFHQSTTGSEFFVRVGNTTRPLDPQAAHDYIGMHWQ